MALQPYLFRSSHCFPETHISVPGCSGELMENISLPPTPLRLPLRDPRYLCPPSFWRWSDLQTVPGKTEQLVPGTNENHRQKISWGNRNRWAPCSPSRRGLDGGKTVTLSPNQIPGPAFHSGVHPGHPPAARDSESACSSWTQTLPQLHLV